MVVPLFWRITMEGIVTKIWNIKEGSMGRGAAVQITDSISYITYSEKCDGVIAGDGLMQVGREVSYVINDLKTLQGLYVGERHISDIQNATDEMMQVKEFHNKLGGRVALHGIVSLPVGESGKENAGKLMMLVDDLLEEIFPDHQAIYAVHTNTENLHVHFVVNTVALNGRKIHMDHNFMSKVFDPYLNKLARQYGFSPNMTWEEEKEPDEIKFSDRVIRLRQAVDTAIEWSDDFDSFLHNLRSQGIKVNCGKYLSLRMEGMPRAIRSFRLGNRYTIDAIRDRLLGKREEMIRSEVGDHILTLGSPAQIYVKTTPLKKYADMDAEEKQEAMRKRLNGETEREREYEVPGFMVTEQTVITVGEKLSRKEQVRAYSPTFQDIYQGLVDEGTELSDHLAAAMDIFVNGSLNLFNHRTNVDIGKRLISFSFPGLKENLRVTSMLIMMEVLRSKLSENSKEGKWTHLYIDEFHELLGIDQIAAFVVKLWKEIRKLLGCACGISQNMSDLLNEENAGRLSAILSNTECFALLAQSSIDKRKLMEFLPNISPAMFNYVDNAESGTGLLKMGSVVIPFDIRMSKESEIYEIVNTDGGGYAV